MRLVVLMMRLIFHLIIINWQTNFKAFRVCVKSNNRISKRELLILVNNYRKYLVNKKISEQKKYLTESEITQTNK